MKPRIIRSAQARLEIARIADYIGQRNIDAGLRFVDAVEGAFQRLADMPTLGERWAGSDRKLADMRVYPVNSFESYVVLYRAIEGGIHVAGVVDGRQDLHRLLRGR